MKRLKQLVQNKRILVFIGLLILSLIIWFMGPYIRFGGENVEDTYAPLAGDLARVVTIVLIFGIWGLVLLISYLSEKKRDKKLIDALSDDAKAELDDDGIELSKSEVDTLKQRFSEALALLKQTRFKGRNNEQSLYQIPWYIIIGPPGSGKTTALLNSGLEFPLAQSQGSDPLQGIGGTRNCDWWFTNEAILLDTAGRYTTQDSHTMVDSSAWLGFLNLLKKYRPRRPINGVIIAISIHDLMTQNAEQRKSEARSIRLRLDELSEQLGVRLPVYVMLTKCDLVAGFSEFFDDLGKYEREQVWGATFKIQGDPEESINLNWFGLQYNSLMERLNQRVIWRMQTERNSLKRKGAIQTFPAQMSGLKTTIFDFIKDTFSSNNYQQQPWLRGVYLTSATQNGTPIDRMMSAVANNFQIEQSVTSIKPGEGKSYFVENLFKKIIFSESSLAGTNAKVESIITVLRNGLYGLSAVLVVVSSIVWFISVTNHNSDAKVVDGYVKTFQEVNASKSQFQQILPALNELKKAREHLTRDTYPRFKSLGLYSPKLVFASKEAYHSQLERLILPYLADVLEQAIVDSNAENTELFNTVRSYIMLGNSKYFEQDVVYNWVSRYLTVQQYSEEDKEKFLDHLGTLLNRVKFQSLTLKSEVVLTGQAMLRQIPIEQRIYQQIRSNKLYARRVILSEKVGDFSALFSIDRNIGFSIPYLFTKEGYQSVDLSKNSSIMKDMVANNWVYGDEGQIDLNIKDIEVYSEKVKAIYLQDYAAQWLRLLSSLKIIDFNSLNDFKRRMAVLIDAQESPIIKMVELVAENTQLTPDVPTDSLAKAAARKAGKARSLVSDAVEGLADKIELTQVDRSFKDMIALAKENEQGKRPLKEFVDLLIELEQYISKLTLASDLGQAAYDLSLKRFSNNGDDAIGNLIYDANQPNVPRVFKQWIESITDSAWSIILASSVRYVNELWRDDVYSSCRTRLTGLYPVDLTSDKDLTTYDFGEFFGVDSVEHNFTKNYLSPFYDIARGFKPKLLNNRTLPLSSQALRQFKRAIEIREVFFKENPDRPRLEFTLTLKSVSPSLNQFNLTMGEQEMVYAPGPRLPFKFTWPGIGQSDQLTIEFKDRQGAGARERFQGDFALFRLLQNSDITKTRKTNEYNVIFRARDFEINYELLVTNADQLLFASDLSQYRCLESL